MFSRPRPRSIFFIILAAITTYFLVFNGPSPRLHIVPYKQGGSADQGQTSENGADEQPKPLPFPTDDDEVILLRPDPGHHHEEPTGTPATWEIDIEDLANWHDKTDSEKDDDVLPGHETDGTPRDPGDVMKLQHEKDLRKLWRYAYKTTAK